MAIIVLTSPGGSPGVTTTALALALAWPGEILLAECDPAGGAVMAGLWRGTITPGSHCLLDLALDIQQNGHASIWEHAFPLEEHERRYVLPGVSDPAQARQLAPLWPAITGELAGLGADVIADIGRYDGGSDLDPLLAAAGMIAMVLRPVVRQVAAARPRLARLAAHGARLGLITVGRGPLGTDGPRLIAETLEVPLLAELPADSASARVLSDGDPPGRGFPRAPLPRAATAAVRALTPAEVPR